MTLIEPPGDATPGDAVLGIDVGAATVKVGIVGPSTLVTDRIPTVTAEEDWSIQRLVAIAADLYARAMEAGVTPANLTVNANGQVDEYHGAVQHSPNLAWHDVAVKDRVSNAVPCEVIVRHSVRAGALAESNLGAARGDGAMLFVSLGVGIIAAGASDGVVVADHVGAGDIGQMRIRSGVGQGRTLEEFASAGAIARRYADAEGIDSGQVTAADVHAMLESDQTARKVWTEAISALGDGLEWASMLFAPETLVLGGGLANAGADLVDPVTRHIQQRFATGEAPAVRLAVFGEYAGLVGAVLTGWKKARWSIQQLDEIVEGLRNAEAAGTMDPR